MEDIKFMNDALREAREAFGRGEIPVGAVVVQRGKIVGRGSNDRLRGTLPFAHAEMMALAEAGERLASWRFDDCTLYVTLEPCPMCAGAITQTRVARVVYGARDPRAGAVGSLYNILQDPRAAHRCAVKGGVLGQESAELLQRFFRGKRKE